MPIIPTYPNTVMSQSYGTKSRKLPPCNDAQLPRRISSASKLRVSSPMSATNLKTSASSPGDSHDNTLPKKWYSNVRCILYIYIITIIIIKRRRRRICFCYFLVEALVLVSSIIIVNSSISSTTTTSIRLVFCPSKSRPRQDH